jgi:SAM-dependent methyltransferase
VEPLLDAAGVAAGMRVLDVETGPGYAAERAAERGAVATGVDIADEVVALARQRTRGIRFLRGDAEDLPFAKRSFEALVCGFGINHFPRPERAIEELCDADKLWEGMLGGSVRTAGLVMSQPPPTRMRVRAAVDRLADDYRVDGGLAIPIGAKISRGRRP